MLVVVDGVGIEGRALSLAERECGGYYKRTSLSDIFRLFIDITQALVEVNQAIISLIVLDEKKNNRRTSLVVKMCFYPRKES